MTEQEQLQADYITAANALGARLAEDPEVLALVAQFDDLKRASGDLAERAGGGLAQAILDAAGKLAELKGGQG